VTVFINSHLLSEVEAFCEYVAILHKGALALEGKISVLLATRGYRVVASGISDQLLNAIRRDGASISPAEDGVEIRVGNRDDANLLIDKVRSDGGLIESVSASTSSLEDLFIRTTQPERAA
jgi:ABC-2 type transport system ATP-binding protein